MYFFSIVLNTDIFTAFQMKFSFIHSPVRFHKGVNLLVYFLLLLAVN